MTPIQRGIIAVSIAVLLGAIYWLFGPDAPDELTESAQPPAIAVPDAEVEQREVSTAPAAPPLPPATPAEDTPETAPAAQASVEPSQTIPAPTDAPTVDARVEPAADDAQEETAQEESGAQPENAEQEEQAALPQASSQAVESEETASARTDERKSSAEFDVVRVEPGGSTLIAGRSVPGAQIKLKMDGKEAGSVTADTTGNFVMFSDLGASETPRVLTLSETRQDGTELEAEASVILGPIVAAQTQEVAKPQDDAGDTALGEPQPQVAALEPVIAPAPDVQSTAPAVTNVETNESAPEIGMVAPAAPTVLVSDETGVRVLQSAGDVPQALTNVSIDTISYDAAGEVALAGRATGASIVRVYLNNSLLIEADIGQNGQWRTQLPDVDTGTYTLRVDEVDASGDVVSRAETPFRRESLEAIRSIEQETELSLAPVSLITVQPGNTLWGIAREKYGEGVLYVRVFDANTDRIRNADLIYPGQIFTVPD